MAAQGYKRESALYHRCAANPATARSENLDLYRSFLVMFICTGHKPPFIML
jgi:hypothetical protein